MKDTSEENLHIFLKTYFEDMIRMIENYDFDILTHLTVPLRYINGKYGRGIEISRYDDTIRKILGMIILVVSLVLSAKDKQSEIKSKSIGIFYLLCLVAFTLNGSNSVLSNIQGKGWAEGANNMVWGMEVTGLYDFMVWTRIFTVTFAAITFAAVFAMNKKDRAANVVSIKKIFKKQPVFAAVIYTAISVCAFICQQVCTPHIDASALYPITTGGTVVLSAIYGRFIYKEKTSWFMWMCIGLTALATVLFMFGGMFPTTWFAGLFA